MKKVCKVIVLSVILLLVNQRFNSGYAQSWEPTQGPFGGVVNCISQSNSYLFVGVGGGVFGKGIFRSANNGANWEVVNNGLSNSPSGKEVVAFGTIGSWVIASTGGGIYRSNNNGNNWIQCSYPGTYIPIAFLTVGNTLVAGGTSGYFVSTDDGATWVSSNSNFPGINPPNYPNIRGLGMMGTSIFVGTQGHGIYRSTDNGLTWTNLNTGLGTTSWVNSQSYNGFASNGTDVFVSTLHDGVYRLLNNGTTWTHENTGLPTSGTTAIISSILIKDSMVYCSGLGGIFSSSNSGIISWTPSNGNIPAQQVTRMQLIGNDIFIALNTKGVFKSSDNGLTWLSTNHGLNGLSTRRIIKQSDSALIAATYEGYIYYSPDLGTNWNVGTISAEAGPCLHGSSQFVGTMGNCYRSTDNGISWQMLQSFNDTCGGPAYTFYSKGDTVYAGCSGLNGVYFSVNDGDTWESTHGITNLSPSGGYPTVISLTSHGQNMYAGTLNGLFYSNDNGLNWTSAFPGIANIPVNAVAVNGINIYAGTSNGLFVSTDNCQSWTPINNGLQNTVILSLAFNDAFLFAGTQGGVFQSANNGSSWTVLNQGFPTLPEAASLVVAGNYLFTCYWLEGYPVYRLPFIGTVPSQPSPIAGISAPCEGSVQNYSVINVPFVTYAWQLPSGWVLNAGSNSNVITVTVGTSAGTISVTPSNTWGYGQPQSFNVTPLSLPATPVISATGNILTSSAVNGNQWYLNGSLIAGATAQSYTALTTGDYTDIVTLNGCSSGASNTISLIIEGISNSIPGLAAVGITPNPNQGCFNLSLTIPSNEALSLSVVNCMGMLVYHEASLSVDGSLEKLINLADLNDGIYNLVISNAHYKLTKKLIINKK